MSSAHVYVRLHKGQTIDGISEGLLEDCAQLVKANSIQGKYYNALRHIIIYSQFALIMLPWGCLSMPCVIEKQQILVLSSVDKSIVL